MTTSSTNGRWRTTRSSPRARRRSAAIAPVSRGRDDGQDAAERVRRRIQFLPQDFESASTLPGALRSRPTPPVPRALLARRARFPGSRHPPLRLERFVFSTSGIKLIKIDGKVLGRSRCSASSSSGQSAPGTFKLHVDASEKVVGLVIHGDEDEVVAVGGFQPRASGGADNRTARGRGVYLAAGCERPA